MKTKTKIYYRIIIVLFLGLVFAGSAMEAWATFISPKRVMIEDRQRSAKLTIHNGSENTTVYRFEWERRAQTPDGKEVLLLKEGEDSPGYQPVGDMLRFSPRQVILKPGEHQKIRFLVRRPADLPEGEYHSHFLIKTEPMIEDVAQEKADPSHTISGTLQIRANVSIPVFLRQGKTSLGVTLKEASLVKREDGNFIQLVLDNDSTRSVYPVSELICDGAKAVPVRVLKLYAEAKALNREIAVPKDFALDQCNGLKLQLSGTDDFEYRRKPIAQIEVRR